MSSVKRPILKGQKGCFYTDFWPFFHPQTTICCGQALLFLIQTTIRHQNCCLNVGGVDGIDVLGCFF